MFILFACCSWLATAERGLEDDIDLDGVRYQVDVCVNTPLSIGVDEEGRPLGDVDLDCDSDLKDLATLQNAEIRAIAQFLPGFTGPLRPHFKGPLFGGIGLVVSGGTIDVGGADLDLDGDEDLITLTNLGNLYVMLSQGGGLFVENFPYHVGNNADRLLIADFNNDGAPDIATPRPSDRDIAVLLNHGDGTFAAPTYTSTSGGYPGAVAVGDVNNDGIVDLVVLTLGTNYWMRVYLGAGNGEFSFSHARTIASGPHTAFLFDFDNDNDLDIAIAFTNSQLQVIKNNGDGTFSLGVYTGYHVGNPMYGLNVVDFDRDGYTDLVFQKVVFDKINILYNIGGEYFADAITFDCPEASDLECTDLDGDGDVDCVTGDWFGSFAVLENPGDDTLPDYDSYPATSTIERVELADYDGDSLLDVGTTHRDSAKVSVFFNSEGKGFSEYPTLPGIDYVTRAVTGDVNGDGLLDVVSCTYNAIEININQGGFVFQYSGSFSIASGICNDLALGDVNNDGFADIAIAIWQDDIVDVMLNAGDGTFHSAVPYECHSSPQRIVLVDIDGDGMEDLVSSHFGRVFSTLINKGGGVFGDFVTYPCIALARSISAGDVDGDGDEDLLLGGIGFSLSLNNSDGTFEDPALFEMDDGVDAELADLNGDSELDVVSVGGGLVQVAINEGKGIFGAAMPYPIVDGREFKIGDMDGDGHADVLVVDDFRELVYFLRNHGNGSLARSVGYFGTSDLEGVDVGDVDNDGDLDIVTAGPYSISIMVNRRLTAE